MCKTVTTFQFAGEAKAQGTACARSHTVRAWQSRDTLHSVGLQTHWLSCYVPQSLSTYSWVSTQGPRVGFPVRMPHGPATHAPSRGTPFKVHIFSTMPRMPRSCRSSWTVMWWGLGHQEASGPHLELAPQVGHLVQPVFLHPSATAPLSRVPAALRLHLVEGQTPQSQGPASSRREQGQARGPLSRTPGASFRNSASALYSRPQEHANSSPG